jgi:transcriptional regulator with XRE-family HTH domain
MTFMSIEKMNKKDVSRHIAKMRNVARLTQPELARKIGVSTRTLARWEGGDNMPKTGMIQEIARICHQSAPEGANLGDLVQAPNDMGGWSIYEEGRDSEAEIKKPPEKEAKMLEKYIKLLEEKVSRLEEDNVRLSDLLHKKSQAVGD